MSKPKKGDEPIYIHICASCGHQMDLQGPDDPNETCENCGYRMPSGEKHLRRQQIERRADELERRARALAVACKWDYDSLPFGIHVELASAAKINWIAEGTFYGD